MSSPWLTIVILILLTVVGVYLIVDLIVAARTALGRPPDEDEWPT